MKWPEPIKLSEPLRDVRLGATPFVMATEDELKAREQKSFELGIREGERRLSQQLLQQRHELLQVQNGVLKSLSDSIDQVCQQCERGLIELALSTAYKLVGDIPINADMVRAVMAETIAQAKDGVELNVRLHPEDLALLERDESIVPSKDGPRVQVTLQPSLEVSRGGCIVETRLGIIDARRETRLELIKQAVGCESF